MKEYFCPFCGSDMVCSQETENGIVLKCNECDRFVSISTNVDIDDYSFCDYDEWVFKQFKSTMSELTKIAQKLKDKNIIYEYHIEFLVQINSYRHIALTLNKNGVRIFLVRNIEQYYDYTEIDIMTDENLKKSTKIEIMEAVINIDPQDIISQIKTRIKTLEDRIKNLTLEKENLSRFFED